MRAPSPRTPRPPSAQKQNPTKPSMTFPTGAERQKPRKRKQQAPQGFPVIVDVPRAPSSIEGRGRERQHDGTPAPGTGTPPTQNKHPPPITDPPPDPNAPPHPNKPPPPPDTTPPTHTQQHRVNHAVVTAASLPHTGLPTIGPPRYGHVPHPSTGQTNRPQATRDVARLRQPRVETQPRNRTQSRADVQTMPGPRHRRRPHQTIAKGWHTCTRKFATIVQKMPRPNDV